MPLFDNYNAINSRQIRPYQGSAVPELVQVSQELQNRYDTVSQGMDYVSRFMNNMQALPQDREALRSWAGQYKEKLKALSQRPDLENAMREVQLLAREVPDGYAPFAERVKEQQEFEKRVMEDKTLNPESKSGIIGKARRDYRGVQMDPDTGRYSGKYDGYNYMEDLDPNERLEEYMKGNNPTTTGYTTEKVNGMWIIKQGGKTVTRTEDAIQKIIAAGVRNDPKMKNWLRQQEDLGTYRTDFSRLKPEDINMSEVRTSIIQKDPKTKKDVVVPVTTGQLIQQAMDQGYSFNQAVESLERSRISGGIVKNLMEAGKKYTVNDRTSEYGISANSNHWAERKEAEERAAAGIGFDVIQPITQEDYSTPTKFDAAVEKSAEPLKAAGEEYSRWMQTNGIKLSGDMYGSNAKWFDKNGNDVTFVARKKVDAIRQGVETRSDLLKRQAELKKKAGFNDKDEKLVEKANKEYREAYDRNLRMDMGDGVVSVSEERAEEAAKNAYDKVLQDSPGYKQYAALLAQDAKNNSAPVHVKKFGITAVDKAMEDQFNNLVVNLDTKGAKFGTQGVMWASGEDANKPFTDKDYKKLIGKAEFAGVAIDNDGQYKAYYKVGTDKTDKNGVVKTTPVLVKLPAPTETADILIRSGQTTQAHQFLAQRIAKTTGSQTIRLGNGLYVEVERTTNTSRQDEFNQEDQFIIKYPGRDGKSKIYPANSLDNAVNHIISTLKTAQ